MRISNELFFSLLLSLFLYGTAHSQTWNVPSNGSTTATYLGTSAGDLRLGYSSTNSLLFQTHSSGTYTTRMTLTSDGKLALGTPGPGNLNVYALTPLLRVENSGTGGGAINLAVAGFNGSFDNNSVTGDAVLYGQGQNLIIKSFTAGKSIKFSTKTTSAEGIRMEIKDNGRVDFMRGESVVTDRNVMVKLKNSYVTGGLNEPTIIFDNGTTSTTFGGYGWFMGAKVAGESYFRIGKYTGTTPTFNEYFKINDDGKVIIGDVASLPYGTPNGYQLFVKTGILTERIKVAASSSTNWADFVFDKNYKLRSLSDLESYINVNHHLPEIPSTEEVGKNGVDLLEMDAKLLQKVEELTLYMIEMKKENDRMKKEIEGLKKELTNNSSK